MILSGAVGSLERTLADLIDKLSSVSRDDPQASLQDGPTPENLPARTQLGIELRGIWHRVGYLEETIVRAIHRVEL